MFSQFPGIGPRQARRFVYYLLTRQNGALEELAKNVLELKKDVIICTDCMRFFQKKHADEKVCKICADPNRDTSTLMIVERDVDLESVERNGGFKGVYFVLGGSIPILEKEPEKRVRLTELKYFIEKKKAGLEEIILGVNWNPEGENTGDFVRKFIETTLQQLDILTASKAQGTQSGKIRISALGKGLSMGSELEYTDPDTLKNALKNRV